ncbi:hypothetical protein [Aquitalea sp.]|uniref:hypothetical protein n=1 Tax=Aquitalea sp. TaxID=1872623 RepID=UPI00258AEBD5|nr:hypothetical protein [Aquitalea sp.]
MLIVVNNPSSVSAEAIWQQENTWDFLLRVRFLSVVQTSVHAQAFPIPLETYRCGAIAEWGFASAAAA